MDKESVLTKVTELSASKRISRQELLDAFTRGQGKIRRPKQSKLTLTNILYAIGALIVVIGIFLFFEQRWATLPSIARILVTFGSGIASYMMGMLFTRVPNMKGVAFAFFLIFAILTPFGISVTLDELDYRSPTLNQDNIIFFTMFAWTITSFLLLRMEIFRVFSVIFGSFFFFSATGALLDSNPVVFTNDTFEYRFLTLGASYFFLGYGVQKHTNLLAQFLYAIGTAMFLGAALSLGGYAPDAKVFWEIIYIGLNFGILFLSVVLRSRTTLVFGSLFLMAYIMKITAEYFSDSFGWPISLIISGLALIAIGYTTLLIGKQYIKSAPANPAE